MTAMRLVTEYLVIVEHSSAAALYDLCCRVEDFERLVRSEPKLSIDGGKIRADGGGEVSWEVRPHDLEHQKQRMFHLELGFDGDTTEVAGYSRLLRLLRAKISEAGGHIETLWDDISLHYSVLSYPLIHASESLMRKLIANFMLITVGKEWLSEASPEAFREAVSKSRRAEYVNTLHQVDFIQLGNFLFRPYKTREFGELSAAIHSATQIEELDLVTLQECVPRSNWERYFSKIVECDDQHLSKQWKRIYDLRCIVAHNALMNRDKFAQLESLTVDVNRYLQAALDNLRDINVPEEDLEAVAEQAAVSINERSGEFLSLWRELESALAGLLGPEDSHLPLPARIQKLAEGDILDEDALAALDRARTFRNRLVHSADEGPSDRELVEAVDGLRQLVSELRPAGRWKDEISNALRTHGGKAKLAEIYAHIEEHSSKERPENWKAVVRYTLQLNSSDTATFSHGGGEDVFVHVGRGTWALRPAE